jgi:hypothetical protein
MTDKELPVIEENNTQTPEVETGTKSTKTYTQEQVDDITNKVRMGAVKNFLKDTYGYETKEDFEKHLEDLKAKSGEIENLKKEYKEKEIKHSFLNNFGGREDAVSNLLASNAELYTCENIDEAIRSIKTKSPFLFNGDKTVINVKRKEELSGDFYTADLKLR